MDEMTAFKKKALFHSLAGKAKLLIFFILGLGAVTAYAEQVLYHVDWQNGIDPNIVQQSNPGGLIVTSDPTGRYNRVLRAKIQRLQDFSGIANGTPRAELILPVRFVQGTTYRIHWFTMLPQDVQFDARQFVIFTQIHQESKTNGSPPLALAQQDNRYAITQRGGTDPKRASAGQWLCCSEQNINKWVAWDLRYRPGAAGADSMTELRRDGALVFSAYGLPNAYPDDNKAYLKIGLYKPEWKLKQSTVDDVSMFYGPVTIIEEDTPKSGQRSLEKNAAY
jgi:hypothetical protein